MINGFSYVITTKDRGADVEKILQSINKVTPITPLELIIVDASKKPSKPKRTGRLKIAYFSKPGCSASEGRNYGIKKANFEVCVFVDDDCIVPENHVNELAASYRDNKVDCVIGSSLPYGSENSTRATRHHKEKRMLSGPWQAIAYVTGNNWSARRKVAIAAGGFDEMLGPGTQFHAAEDLDFLYRLLAHKFRVFVNPDLKVLHLGKEEKPFEYSVGLGAFFSKHFYDWHIRLFLLLFLLKWRLLGLYGANHETAKAKLAGVDAGFRNYKSKFSNYCCVFPYC